MNTRKRTFSKWMMAIGLTAMSLMLVAYTGCSDDDDSDPAGPSDEPKGEIRMTMVDAPAAFEAVNVVVTEVSVHKADDDSTSGWETIRDDEQTYNLLELRNGASAVLGDTTLAAGHYNQIRLKLGAGSHVIVAGQTFDLEVPSGMQSGLKLNHQFTIEENATYELTLDFNAEASIHMNGLDEYILRPVIRVVAAQTSGEVSGTVLPIDAHAMITAMSESDTVMTYADTTDGTFRLMAVPEGGYDLEIEARQGTYLTTTLSDVQVEAMQTTSLGIMTLSGGE